VRRRVWLIRPVTRHANVGNVEVVKQDRNSSSNTSNERGIVEGKASVDHFCKG